MIDITPLLQPVSADNPCGPDISYDPLFLKLEGLLAGKPETQFSASEEPAWSAIRDTCVELLVRSKNLRVAVTLCVALVKLDGAAGLRDGLSLLTELLVRYWPDLYPKLDPEEHNDPLERINILSSLATPIGTFGDPVRFLERVRQIPLARSKRMETFSFADIAGDKRLMPGGQERAPASQGEIAAAFKDTGPIALAATDLALTESIALATKLDNFLTTTVGTKRSSDMSALSNLLREIKKALGPHVPKPAEDPGRAPAELAGASPWNPECKAAATPSSRVAMLFAPWIIFAITIRGLSLPVRCHSY